MLKLKVSYFLKDEGVCFFQSWYDKVVNITSTQDGFLNMYSKKSDSDTKALVYLYFENQEKLDNWVETKIHDDLVAEIAPYLTKTEVEEF